MKLPIVLYAAVQALRLQARRHPALRARIAERNLVFQVKLADDSVGRYLEFRDGRILSRGGNHDAPDVTMTFKNERVALKMLSLKPDHLFNIDAMKNFKVAMVGPDELVYWLTRVISLARTLGWEFGEELGDGVRRYTNTTNGGPLHVHVKDGRIVRMVPIEFTDDDAPGWTIEARGRSFTPPRQTTATPYAIASKSLIYSKDRALYPMKRVDFDPHGARNTHLRGISGYERISWDEAYDLVGGEMQRMKREHGPGAIALSHGSHHAWGNVNYYLSALYRFFNLVGFTKVMHNPDSWEGWYWGAVHHWGHTMRLGAGETYGQVEDCLKACEMIVFWSADPEATSGLYAGYEATLRRQWAQELGIKFVHIDPHWNHTAALFGGKWIAPRPGTDPALAQAICHVWIDEGTYDKRFVAERTTGFDAWADYIMGRDDGTPKGPAWAERETGVPAHDIRALAREWAARKTYLGAGSLGNGFGGAARGANGHQWARMMVILMAMQGIGRPGVNFGHMQMGAPLDFSFWFPGYAEGGISGDLVNTGCAPNTYQRIPHVLTMNTCKQIIPRIRLADAILDGEAEGWFTDPTAIAGQFIPYRYPAPGHSPVKMLYKYGGAALSTMPNANRWIEMYRSDKLECVVSQTIWHEGESKFADVILPACTNFERHDIGEWASAGGYGHQFFAQLNHRVIVFQHQCIEPLGESKSDYDIFAGLATRLGVSSIFTEGMSALEWCRRIFEGSDLAERISWKEFIRKGYFVVPAENPKTRAPCAYRWFYEGRKKDVPEPHPLPADYTERWLEGLQTQSGKFEFVPESLKKFDDPERPPICRYTPSREGTGDAGRLARFPLLLLSGHTRYSFHSLGDGKDTTLNDIRDHRLLVDGYYYLELRLNPDDAAARGIRQDDLVRVFNDRGEVICAATVSNRLRPGIAHSYESSAIYEALGEPGRSPDRGGCVNVLTSDRSQTLRGSSMGPSHCQVEIERWPPAAVDAPAGQGAMA